MSATFDTYLRMRRTLAKHGVPMPSAWWLDTIRAFYEHPTARTLHVCAGRGSSKSTELYALAMCETLFGDWSVPPGERHWASLSSLTKPEAGKGLSIVSSWLTLLRVPHKAVGDVIELRDMPRGIRITAASVEGNSGWRSFFDGDDEVAKWQTEGALTVDAAEVLASKRAMTVTHARARHVLFSSPFLDAGPFFEAVRAGSNEHQIVRVAPTWVATDGRMSEEQTRALETNPRIHAREYGAEFGQEWTLGFFGGVVDANVGDWSELPPRPGVVYAMAIDPAFARDLFAGVVCHAEGDTVIVDRVLAITPPRGGEGLSPTDCLRKVRDVARSYRVAEVLTDQFNAATLTDLAAREELALTPIPWTSTSKAERFEKVRVLFRDGRCKVPNDAPLLRELSGIAARMLPSGHEQIQGRPGFTDDRVSALVLAVSHIATAKRVNPWIAALTNASPNSIAGRLGFNAPIDSDTARFVDGQRRRGVL